MNDQIELPQYDAPQVRPTRLHALVREIPSGFAVDVRRAGDRDWFFAAADLTRDGAVRRAKHGLVQEQHLPFGFEPSRLTIEDANPAPRYRADRRSVADVLEDRCRGTTFSG